jgi:hypothetical protein
LYHNRFLKDLNSLEYFYQPAVETRVSGLPTKCVVVMVARVLEAQVNLLT